MSGSGCRLCGGSGWVPGPGGKSIRCFGDQGTPSQGLDPSMSFTSTLVVEDSDSRVAGDDYGTYYDKLQSFDTLDSDLSREDALLEARKDFTRWVEHAVFAEEGDTTRGRYWEGATRYATTPEGEWALRKISENPDTTSTLRTAAGAMLVEVEEYKATIRSGWLVEDESFDLSAAPAPATALVEEGAYVDKACLPYLSPDTKVTGPSAQVVSSSRTTGTVLISESEVSNAGITDSYLSDGSSVRDAHIYDSTLSGASVRGREDRTLSEYTSHPTIVRGSNLGQGSRVAGALVQDSAVEGSVVGTGTKNAGLVDSKRISDYYEVYYYAGSSIQHSDKADPKIGKEAEAAAYSKVVGSKIGKRSEIRNSSLANTVVKDGVNTNMAIISDSTLEGTAHVAGNYEHRLEKLEGYSVLEGITVRDRRARVSNVRLTREFIGEAAEVEKQSHVESVVQGGMVVTRYRTRFRTRRMRRAIWAYTTTKVDPKTGSLERQFVGYDNGSDSSPAVRQVMSLF